jgi:hypothetical protein
LARLEAASAKWIFLDDLSAKSLEPAWLLDETGVEINLRSGYSVKTVNASENTADRTLRPTEGHSAGNAPECPC